MRKDGPVTNATCVVVSMTEPLSAVETTLALALPVLGHCAPDSICNNVEILASVLTQKAGLGCASP